MKQKLVGNDSEMSNSDFDMRHLRKQLSFLQASHILLEGNTLKILSRVE